MTSLSELFAGFPCAAAAAVSPARLAGPEANEDVLRLAVDGNGVIVAVSHNCHELTGRQPEQMLGAALADYSPGEWLGDLLAGETPEYWADFKHGNGRTVRIRWHNVAQVAPGLVLLDGEVRP